MKRKAKAEMSKKPKTKRTVQLTDSSSSSSSSSPSSSESSSDESDDGRSIKKSMRQIQMEQLTRSRMIEARPKTEEQKYGDDGKVDYKALKNRFMSTTKVKGVNYVDVLNEMPHWFKGAPKRMVEAFQGAENPKEAVNEAWKQLDGFFELRIQTAAERIQPIIASGKVDKNDLEGHLNLLADLGGVRSYAKIAGVEEQLSRVDIIRDLVMAKVPYAADEFYSKEAKEKRKNPHFRYNFNDLFWKIEERAQVLKAQGKTVTTTQKSQTAKVAATSSQAPQFGPKTYGNVVKESPPKQQPPIVHCVYCNNRHQTNECSKLKEMTLEKRLTELKRKGMCFRCLEGGHLARECDKSATVKCKECGGRHQTLLHGRIEIQEARPVLPTGQRAQIQNVNATNQMSTNGSSA